MCRIEGCHGNTHLYIQDSVKEAIAAVGTWVVLGSAKCPWLSRVGRDCPESNITAWEVGTLKSDEGTVER